jgi:23S rRNA (cytosine1962-C5)-methyltransferase
MQSRATGWKLKSARGGIESGELNPQTTRLIIFEDEHLLVANKPAGWNTHAPSPFAGEGVYEWLRNSHPSRANLAIMHRLDKDTSGLIVFGKGTAANRSLSAQFEGREVRKKYVLLSDRRPAEGEFTVKSALVRAGEKYASRPISAGGVIAETRFRVVTAGAAGKGGAAGGEFGKREVVVEAEPLTGRTHQIRVHAAERGFPVLGDSLYGGGDAARLCLHAAELEFRHPITHAVLTFKASPDFSEPIGRALRAAIIDFSTTDTWRMANGAADGWPGLYVDRLGEILLAQSANPLDGKAKGFVELCAAESGARGVFFKTLRNQPGRVSSGEASPQWLSGEVKEQVFVRENGVRFALRLDEGYSTGLFLDQRENRRRLLTGYVAPGFHLEGAKEVLNTFAYTCGFSVCAAMAGMRVTSVDLSKKYLAWGKENFALNGLDAAGHDFVFGDTFDWLRRFSKRGRSFDVIIADPPTFSRSREGGVFRVEKDYGRLVEGALGVLRPKGVILASTNSSALAPEDFVDMIHRAIAKAGRRVLAEHYAPQPPDFPVHRDEPAYLKTVWLRIS